MQERFYDLKILRFRKSWMELFGNRMDKQKEPNNKINKQKKLNHKIKHNSVSNFFC